MSFPPVLVAIPTYRRPESLRTLLDLLQRVKERHSMAILVLDNDPDGSASALSSHEAVVGGEILAVAGGLASVRNAALERAETRGVHCVAFLDDDMRPEQEWLRSMLNVQKRFAADLVVGAIHQPPGIDSLPHARAILRRFDGQKEGPTDQDITSGNLLVSMDFVRRSGIRFDTSLDSSGAEDTWFGRQARQHGAVVAYAPEAAAAEMNEASSVTPWRLARRSIANGRTLAALDRLAQTSPPRAWLMVRLVGAGAVTIPGAAVAALRGDRVTAWRHVFTLCRNVGRFLGPSTEKGPYRGLGRLQTGPARQQ